MKKGKGPGWYGESRRHALASKGIKTAQRIPKMLRLSKKFSAKEGNIVGVYNYMTPGKIINNPTYLFNLEGSNQYYGDFDATVSHLDRTVGLTENLSISEQEKYKKDKEPTVNLIRVVNGKIKVEKYKYDAKKQNWLK